MRGIRKIKDPLKFLAYGEAEAGGLGEVPEGYEEVYFGQGLPGGAELLPPKMTATGIGYVDYLREGVSAAEDVFSLDTQIDLLILFQPAFSVFMLKDTLTKKEFLTILVKTAIASKGVSTASLKSLIKAIGEGEKFQLPKIEEDLFTKEQWAVIQGVTLEWMETVNFVAE